MTFSTRLEARAVIGLSGPEATHFLERLVTSALPEPGRATFAALLTPQGKILFDFFLVALEDGYLIDVGADQADGLIKRLTFYRLRANVIIADRRGELGVAAMANPRRIEGAVAFADPRDDGLGIRVIAPEAGLGDIESAPETYEAARIARGMPEGGIDYAFGDAFPHDAGLDQTGGVDFGKGCFVGQEVVSRMQHRGTARRRPVIVKAAGATLTPGAAITGGGPPIGTLTSVTGRTGIAIVRLDRAGDAATAGTAIRAGDISVTLTRPPWADYAWPAALAANDGEAA